MSTLRPLIVFADDWGRHPSSCQHLIRYLLPARQVIWVNTIGTHPPQFNRATFLRAMGKFRQWFLGGSIAPPTSSATSSPKILNPKMWPSFRSSWARGLNRRLLMHALRPELDLMTLEPIVITTLPLMADLVGLFPARWIYYCVDDFGVWPGLDGGTMRSMEVELVAKVDEIIAVSEVLQAHIAALGKPSHLLTHGVDLDHWRIIRDSNLPLHLSEFSAIPEPRIVFWGVIDRRMDVAFLRDLSEEMTEGSIVLIGPEDNPDPALMLLERVRLHPAVDYFDLPAIAAHATVLIMPYADLPVTRALQPLKLKEYLATGKPVVVRSLPSTSSWADCLDLATTPDGFSEVVLERVTTGIPECQRLERGRLQHEGWAAKAKEFAAWLK